MLKLNRQYRLTAAIIFCGLAPSVLRAETGIAELVVRIDVQYPGLKKFGAGILFAHSSGKTWIVTAKHVIVDTEPAQTVLVTFLQDKKRQVKAELAPPLPSKLDVGVISVADTEMPPGLLRADLFPATIVGDASDPGNGVFVFGHPNGASWELPAVPDYVSRVENDTIRFQSNFVTVGHSGGALIGRGGGLMGMVTGDEPPFAFAIRIDTIKRVLKESGYGVQLKSLAAQQDFDESASGLGSAAKLYGSSSIYLKEYEAWIQFSITTFTVGGCTMTVDSSIHVSGTGKDVNTHGRAIDHTTALDLGSFGAPTLSDFRVTDLAAPVLGELGWTSFSPITDRFTAVTLQKGSQKFSSSRTIETSRWPPLRETKRVIPQDRVYLIFPDRQSAETIQAGMRKAMQYCASLSKPD